MLILDAITKKAKQHDFKEVNVSFEEAFLLVEAEGVTFKIEITEVRKVQTQEYNRG